MTLPSHSSLYKASYSAVTSHGSYWSEVICSLSGTRHDVFEYYKSNRNGIAEHAHSWVEPVWRPSGQ